MARARAEFLNHTCSLSGGATDAEKWSYFLLSKVRVFESAGVLVVTLRLYKSTGQKMRRKRHFTLSTSATSRRNAGGTCKRGIIWSR